MKNKRSTAHRLSILFASLFLLSATLVEPMRSHLQSSDDVTLAPAQTFTVTNTNNSGAGSLTQAITDANANPGLDTINFNVAGSGIQYIFVNATLPAITSPVVIDATTQPGYAGTPLIHLEGMGTGQAINITAGGSTIKGLSFTSFFAGTANGIIKISGPGNNVITSCAFGVRGDSTRPTTASIGVLIDASNNNRVGGTTAAERNYFAVTNEQNLVIQNGASGNRITGNWFGTGPNGTRMPSTGRDAIRILNSPNNMVGGSVGTTPGGVCTGECNVIAGAGNNGVFINGNTATGNRVLGNFIGLFADGSSTNQNNIGVRVDNAPGNVVGGTTGGERNVITGNDGLANVYVTGAGSTGTVITGNYLGLFPNGTSTPAAATAALDGVLVNGGATATRIGGTTAGERNVISGLRNNGIEIAGANSNLVQGNYIGTDVTGMLRSTTVGNGIGLFFADNNIVGGTEGTTLGGACTGACNVVSGNGNNGVSDGIFLTSANNNTIDGNYIGLNAAGTQAIVNGRTPDGGTFNGHSIFLLNSSTNTVGRRSGTSPRQTERNAHIGEVATSPDQAYCIQDANGYLAFNDETFAYVYRDCRTGAPPRSGIGPLTLRKNGTIAFVSEPFRSLWQIKGTVRGIVGRVSVGEDLVISDPNVFEGECVCPPMGHQLVAGGVEIKIDNGASDSNYIGDVQSGYTVSGTFIGDLPQVPIKIQGNDTEIKNVDLGSFSQSDIEFIQGISNRWLESYLDHPVGLDGVFISPGGNGNIPPPTITEMRVRDDGTVSIVVDIVGGPPNSQVRLSLYSYGLGPGAQNFGTVRNIPLPINDIPLVILDANGNGTATVIFDDMDSETIRNYYFFAVQATQFVSPNRGEVGMASPNALRGSSRLSAPSVVKHAGYNFDQDNRTDLAVYRRAAGSGGSSTWYLLNSRDNSSLQYDFGSIEDKLVTDDYNGDRVPDLAVWRPSTGTWYVARPNGAPAQNFDAIPWGLSSDIPIHADFDGDGRTDIGVFRPSEGIWYIRESFSGQLYARQWGQAGDKLVPADYNGDGKTEIAVFRNGIWYITPCPTCSIRYEYFGLSSDVPVPADYDGDGRVDVAVWRPSNGIWYINGSRSGFVAYQWGTNGDKPLCGDFDGDGRNDIAVFRPSEGNWYILQSSNSAPRAIHWGQNGDIPVPSFEAKYHS
jgi:hypothetical protein